MACVSLFVTTNVEVIFKERSLFTFNFILGASKVSFSIEFGENVETMLLCSAIS
jgi:hypothetical protein